MYNNIPTDVQIVTFGVSLWKYLFFIFFLSQLAFQVSSCNLYSFWNNLKEDSSTQVQTLTIIGCKIASLIHHYIPLPIKPL